MLIYFYVYAKTMENSYLSSDASTVNELPFF